MSSSAKDKLKAKLLDLAILLIGTTLISALLVFEGHLAPFVSQLPPKTIIRVGIALLLIVSWLGFFLWRSYPRLKFDSRLQIWRDKRSGLFYCPSCRSKKLFSPLGEEKNGWRCGIKECNQFYRNPDYNDDFHKRARPSWKTV